ncbi:MacA family efflux pump subunit [Acinetobacter sp. HY1485]|uniref:MacA family efflux pump subunit n=1 Tax=Acinetobacter sp. HY1485 TaxID=2970918 RepID=UPI0022B97D6B|nr:MacA family efflux pump subunit [Acinetobacter sp. HY1485]
MSKKTIKITLTILILAILGFGAWHYFKPKEEQPQYITETVTRGNLENTVLATGTLDATKLVSVGSQASGQVKKMYVELGDEVKKGQLIAQIDSETQQNTFKNTAANIRNLEAQRLQQEANLNEKRLDFNRQKVMLAQDATPRATFEAAEASYKTAQAQVKAVDAQIEQAKLSESTAKTNLGYTRIIAPMDGTIVAIVTEEGQTVNANQSTPTIVKLAQLQNMTIKAQVSEADIMKVEKGQKVYFTTLGDSTKRYATLRQIEPAPESISSDSSTSTSSSSSSTAIYYNALFDVPNTDGKLRIDMTAQVYIVLNDANNSLLLPSAALGKETPHVKKLELTAEQKNLVAQGKASLGTVRILDAQGKAHAQQVLVGINNRVNAQVLAGVKEGDEVVIADSSDTSAAAAKSKSGRRNGPPMGM